MTQEKGLAALRPTVMAWERLRLELLGRLRAAGEPEQAALRLELVRLYGQAFAKVVAALSGSLTPDSESVLVLHEAIRGADVFQHWQDAGAGPAATWEDLDRLSGHWDGIVDAVLDTRG